MAKKRTKLETNSKTHKNRSTAKPGTPPMVRPTGKTASPNIEQRIKELGGWRADILGDVRRMILEADPNVVEESKWVKPTNPSGVPVWSHAGIVCTGEVYKDVVKLTFARGAILPDPRGLFNSGLDGNTRRAIDIREGESLHPAAFKALIRAAVGANLRAGGSKAKSAKNSVSDDGSSKPVKLLSGGNPQIAKGDGDAPVQAYIAAMPGWKRDIGQRLDALIERTVPNVRKAVRWNSPFYGTENRGWFLGTHCLTKYVKVTFFYGLSLQPIPPGGTPKSRESRWIDIYEGMFDEGQMESWVRQAADLPGWVFG